MKDAQVIELLRSGKQVKAFRILYRDFPQVRRLIINHGGGKEDAEDIYQEALIILCRKVQSPRFALTSSLGTYLYSICRFLWKDALKKQNRMSVVDDLNSENGHHDEADFERLVQEESRFMLAEEALMSIGDRCREVLRLFYIEGLTMEEIAERLGFSSENVAKNQKYKCIERARESFREMQATTVPEPLNYSS